MVPQNSLPTLHRTARLPNGSRTILHDRRRLPDTPRRAPPRFHLLHYPPPSVAVRSAEALAAVRAAAGSAQAPDEPRSAEAPDGTVPPIPVLRPAAAHESHSRVH